jgi:hypothetical protein
LKIALLTGPGRVGESVKKSIAADDLDEEIKQLICVCSSFEFCFFKTPGVGYREVRRQLRHGPPRRQFVFSKSKIACVAGWSRSNWKTCFTRILRTVSR